SWRRPAPAGEEVREHARPNPTHGLGRVPRARRGTGRLEGGRLGRRAAEGAAEAAVLSGGRLPAPPCSLLRLAKVVRAVPGRDARPAAGERRRPRRYAAVFLVPALAAAGAAPGLAEAGAPMASAGTRLPGQH